MTFRQLRDAIDELEKWNGLDENPKAILNILKNFSPRKIKQEFEGITITRCKDVTHDDYNCILFDKYYEIIMENPPTPDKDYITVNCDYLKAEDVEELEELGVYHEDNQPI